MTYFLFEDEHYLKPISVWRFYFIMGLIMLSTVAFVLETIPEIRYLAVWFYMEVIISIIFTLELSIRVAVCRNPIMICTEHQRDTCYFHDMMNLIDLASIVPFYVDLVLLLFP